MKIANEFTVSAPIERAWEVLTDLEQVIPLMPGASMTGREGDDVLGKVKVKVGPVTSEFNGKVHFVEQDRSAYRAVIDGRGKESRGTGNAAATVTAQLHEAGDSTRVTVDTDLKIVGKLAQFGSGMLQQVSEKLLGEFVRSLEAKLTAPAVADGAVPAAATDGAVPAGVTDGAAAPAPSLAPAPPPPVEAPPIDLLQLAGGGMLKKYAPLVLGAFGLAALIFTLGRLGLARRARCRRR
jgi:carbon monoxide dehydrogenase subunit G